MRAHFVIGAVGVAVLGASVATQQNRHINPMVDLLIAKKAIYGLGVPTTGRGGGNRAGQGAPAAGGTGAAAPTAAPATPPPPPRTPVELAKDALAHPEADFFFTAMMERNIDGGSATMLAFQDALAEVGNSPGRRIRAFSCRSTPRRRTSRARTCRPIPRTTSPTSVVSSMPA